MRSIPSNPTDSFKRRNPHLYGMSPSVVLGKRVRQEPRQQLNKLESEWHIQLLRKYGPGRVRVQAKRYQLANGVWYKPDFTVSSCSGTVEILRETAWEVKGPKVARWSRRGELTLKFAARAWPEVRWFLVWKEGGEWRQQEVLP